MPCYPNPQCWRFVCLAFRCARRELASCPDVHVRGTSRAQTCTIRCETCSSLFRHCLDARWMRQQRIRQQWPRNAKIRPCPQSQRVRAVPFASIRKKTATSPYTFTPPRIIQMKCHAKYCVPSRPRGCTLENLRENEGDMAIIIRLGQNDTKYGMPNDRPEISRHGNHFSRNEGPNK